VRRGRSESGNAPREVGTPPTCRTACPAMPRSWAVPARTRSALPQRARAGGCRRSPPLRRLAFGAAGGLIARRRGAKSSSPTPLAAREPRHPAEAVSYAGVPPYAGSVHANAALWPQHDPRGYVGGVGRAHEAHATRRPAQRPGQQLAVNRFCRERLCCNNLQDCAYCRRDSRHGVKSVVSSRNSSSLRHSWWLSMAGVLVATAPFRAHSAPRSQRAAR